MTATPPPLGPPETPPGPPADPPEPPPETKYARPERERRFLLARFPDGARTTAVRRITDRYLDGTRLRLRRVDTVEPAGTARVRKFTQKLPGAAPPPALGLITNTYLSEAEYDVLAALPAAVLRKTRHSVPPFGIDVFEGPLAGLVLAEAEFDTDAAMAAFRPPPFALAEVTADQRFTGGRLVRTTRAELGVLLAEFDARG